MKLSIIIPIYNEKETIEEIISRIEKIELKNIKKEIILIDDFSKDGTRELLKKYTKKYIVLFHPKNKGKGSAIKTGLKEATGDIILIQDADLEYSPEDYPSLLKPILSNETSVVYGSRFMGFNLTSKFKTKSTILPLHFIGNKFLSFITQLLFFSKITDMETCYKVFRKDVIKNLDIKSNHFNMEPEITARILKKRINIKELPISYNPRSIKEGKKINWKDGIQAIYTLFYWRFAKSS